MTKLGVNFPSRAAFQTALKKPLDAGVRCYNMADARRAHADGFKVTVSYKTGGTFAQGAQNDAAFDRAIAMEVASWGPGNTLAKNHEPENDGQPAPDFVAMTTAFRNSVESVLHAAGCRWGICLIMDTFRKGTADQWIGSLKPDVLAADGYMWLGATGPYAPSEKQPTYVAFAAYLDYCKTHSQHPELWEFGCSRTQADTAGVHRSEKLEWFAANARTKEFEGIFYFESPPPVVDWEIRTEPRSMTAVASMGSAVTPPPPPPPGETDAQKIARLTAELVTANTALAAANTQITQLQATNATLTGSLSGANTTIAAMRAKGQEIVDL